MLAVCSPAMEEPSRLNQACGSTTQAIRQRGAFVGFLIPYESPDWESSDEAAIEDSDTEESLEGDSIGLSFHKKTVLNIGAQKESLLTSALSGKPAPPMVKSDAPPKNTKVCTSGPAPKPKVHFRESKPPRRPNDSERIYEHPYLRPLGFDEACVYGRDSKRTHIFKNAGRRPDVKIVHRSKCLCDKKFVPPCPEKSQETKSWYDLVEEFRVSTF